MPTTGLYLGSLMAKVGVGHPVGVLKIGRVGLPVVTSPLNVAPQMRRVSLVCTAPLSTSAPANWSTVQYGREDTAQS